MSDIYDFSSLLESAERHLFELRPQSSTQMFSRPIMSRRESTHHNKLKVALSLSPKYHDHAMRIGEREDKPRDKPPVLPRDTPNPETESSPQDALPALHWRTPSEMKRTKDELSLLVGEARTNPIAVTSKLRASPRHVIAIVQYLFDESDVVERVIRRTRPKDSVHFWLDHWYTAREAAYFSVSAWEHATNESETNQALVALRESFGWIVQYWPFTRRSDDLASAVKISEQSSMIFQGLKPLVDYLSGIRSHP